MKVVFLDRDGVINEYPGDGKYVTNWKEFKFIPGSIEAIRKLNENKFKVFVISNQAGVAKGGYSQNNLDAITERMLSALGKKKAGIDGVYYCTHHPEDKCLCRKPGIGLLERALKDSGINPTLSFFIGDSATDIMTAKNFGITSVLLLSGKEKISLRDTWLHKPDYIFDNLLLASHYLCSHYGC